MTRQLKSSRMQHTTATNDGNIVPVTHVAIYSIDCFSCFLSKNTALEDSAPSIPCRVVSALCAAELTKNCGKPRLDFSNRLPVRRHTHLAAAYETWCTVGRIRTPRPNPVRKGFLAPKCRKRFRNVGNVSEMSETFPKCRKRFRNVGNVSRAIEPSNRMSESLRRDSDIRILYFCCAQKFILIFLLRTR